MVVLLLIKIRLEESKLGEKKGRGVTAEYRGRVGCWGVTMAG